MKQKVLTVLGSPRKKGNSATLTEKIRNLADSNGIDAFGFAEASEFKDYVLNRY